jgi:hypothetical protein
MQQLGEGVRSTTFCVCVCVCVLFVACGPTLHKKCGHELRALLHNHCQPPATQNYNNIPVHKSVANVESIIKAVIKLLLSC